MVASTAAGAAYFAVGEPALSGRSTGLALLGIMLGSAALGKLIGLALARMRLAMLLHQLERSP